MAAIIVVGDGPAGLSAALFLAKNGHEVTVYGTDDTPMHYALLYNYLGIDEQTGSEFQLTARRQVEAQGASIVDAQVTEVSQTDDHLDVRTADGATSTADYLILATAKKGVALAQQLGIDSDRDGLDVDGEYRTTVDRVYAVGRLARPGRSQAIISAGAGAIAALDVLAREAGTDVTDWDTPDDD